MRPWLLVIPLSALACAHGPAPRVLPKSTLTPPTTTGGPAGEERIVHAAFTNLREALSIRERLVMKPREAVTPLNRPAMRMTQPRSIQAEVGQPPSFGLLTPFSWAVNNPAQRRLRLRLRDPSIKVATVLARDLAQKYSLRNFPTAFPVPRWNPADEIPPVVDEPTLPNTATAEERPDLAINVETSLWFLFCSGSNEAPCRVTYDGTMRMLDNRTGRMLAAGDCRSTPIRPEVGRREGGYVIDPVAVEAAFDEAADNCIDFFLRDLFGIYTH